MKKLPGYIIGIALLFVGRNMSGNDPTQLLGLFTGIAGLICIVSAVLEVED